MRKYKHIFFDLDRTLWDFDSNSAQTLLEILRHFKLEKQISDTNKWTDFYRLCNKKVWKLFDEKKLNKQELRVERFRLLFEEFNITSTDIITEVSNYYIKNSPKKTGLMPLTLEILKYLSKNYSLYIVSNGFYDAQLIKMKHSGIDAFFNRVFTSDNVLAAKPDKKIFQYALKTVNARKDQSIFIGDSLENDIIGAHKFGIDQVWYNHDNVVSEFTPTHEIKSLLELKNIL